MNCFGINLWNWTNGLGPDCLGLPAKIAEMGFDAVELPMTQPAVDERLAREIRANGLKVTLCAAMSPGRDLSNFDPQIRADTMDYLLRCLDTAQQLGAGVFAGPLYTGGGKRHLLPPEQAAREWELAVTGLRTLSARAKECGVKLAIEPLNRYRTSVVNTAEQGLRMVRDVGKENVGIHFDTFHAGIEESDLCGALESVLAAGKLFHLHACANNRGAPGQGFFPWDRIFGLTRSYGYQGHITMETFAPGGLDSGWTQLGESPDELALSGLRYLRSIFSE
ncbi:MAG: sugar phosphate isomerase/epimerase [Ruminococcaceae bacterium]|nr:sugar phosphate isomerase/epimerase [Oscillospiraceae bacterium]